MYVMRLDLNKYILGHVICLNLYNYCNVFHAIINALLTEISSLYMTMADKPCC